MLQSGHGSRDRQTDGQTDRQTEWNQYTPHQLRCSGGYNDIHMIPTYCHGSKLTGTTRTPAFWGYPPPPHDYPYHGVILDPKWKEDKVKVTNLKNWILKRALHATHLLKLLDKMCKYEMDPMSIVEDTERTRLCPQTDRRTDGQGDTSIPPFQLRWSGGYNDSSTTFQCGNKPSPICQCKYIFSWVSRKLAHCVCGILYRIYMGHLFWGEFSMDLASHTAFRRPNLSS